MRTPLIAGNWKMNGSSQSIAELLDGIVAGCGKVADVEFAVMPPFVYLEQVSRTLQGTPIKWGVQNVSEHPKGAFTGEVAASMVKDFNCQYVIVGHSERRALYAGTNEVVAQKFKLVMESNMWPILCVGETLAEREAGKTLDIVHEQLACILNLKDNLPDLSHCVIAYEPVWAIGTGQTATPEQAQDVHAAIRAQWQRSVNELASQVRILYGGSVKPSNAAALMAMPDIDGALVGGASLDASQFLEIGKQCNHL